MAPLSPEPETEHEPPDTHLLFVNGLAMTTGNDYEVGPRGVRFTMHLVSGDNLIVVFFYPGRTAKYEWRCPFGYPAGEWIDPSNPHPSRPKELGVEKRGALPESR